MKKIICSLALLIVGATAYAEDTDISKYDNVVYIESSAKISLADDGSAIIPIKMKNSVEATGYQFTLTLPAGITTNDVKIKKSTVRKAEDVSFSSAVQQDGTIKVLCYTTDGGVFTGNDGEVATITITNAQVGSYTFSLSGIEVTAGGTAYKINDPIVSTVNIKNSIYNNVIYLDNDTTITIEKDGSAVIPVKMKNNVEATGYQFTLTLPVGITASDVKINKSTVRKATDVSFSSAVQQDGTIKVLCYTTDGGVFTGNDGEVATITITNAQIGSYTFSLSGIEVTAGGTAYKTEDTIEAIVNIQGELYDEGYSLQVVPFAMVANQSYDQDITNTTDNKIITLSRANVVALKKVTFDMVLPENISVGQYSYKVKTKTYYDYDPYYYNEYDPEAESFSTPTLTDNEDGSVNIVAEKDITASTGTPFIVLPLVSTNALASGIYEITIKNIVMTDENDNTYKAKPYIANIFVGSEKAKMSDGKVTFSGDYSNADAAQLLLNAIPSENDSLTEVDLTGVTSLPENTKIETANPNVLVETKIDLKLANTKNVVIGDQCAELELNDGYNFAASKDFTAADASYSRTMTTDWGTVCLPYEVQSDASAAYYNIKEIKNSTLYLEKYETLPVGTPAIVKKLSGSEIAPKSTSVSVSGEIGDITGTVTMVGTYTNNTKVTAANAYYLKDNKFYQCNGYFYINAFRAYFIVDSSAKVFEIADGDATGIEETSLIPSLYEEKNVYNLSGQKVNDSYKGIVIIGGKKIINK